MKRLSIIFALCAALLLIVTSCSKKQSANLIPDDAIVVLRLDPVTMQKQSGLNDGKSGLSKWMKDNLNDTDMPKKLRKMALEIIDDPMASGIDFSEPLFFYVAGEDIERKPDLGLVGCIASQDKLSELVEEVTDLLDIDVKEADGGIKYVSAEDGALVYSADWFYLGTAFDIDETIETLKQRVEGKNTLAGNDTFEKMCNKDGLMQMLFLGSGFEDLIYSTPELKEAMKEAMKTMPEGVKLEDMAYLADLSLGDGEMLLVSEYLPLSSAMRDYFNECEKIVGDISKDQTRYMSGRFLNAFLNIDAKKYFDIMKPMLENELGDEAAEAMPLIEEVVNNLDGTLSAELYDIKEGQPQFNIYVGTKNSDALDLFMAQTGMELESNAPGEYLIPNTEYDFESDSLVTTGYFGLGFKNGQIYFTSDPEQAFTEPSDKFPASELKGKGFYIRFNFGALNDLAKNADSEERDLMNKVAGTYDYVEAYYEKGGKGIFRITTKSKKTNPVKALVEMVKEYL